LREDPKPISIYLSLFRARGEMRRRCACLLNFNYS